MAKKTQIKATKTDAPSTPAPTQSASMLNLPAGFSVRKQITVPTLTLKDASGPRILTIGDAMRVSTYVDPDPKKAKEKPATVCGVTDEESGELFQFLVPSVVESNLRRDYPEDGYVGKTFRIQCLGKRPNKRYRDFSIFEVAKA